MKKKVFIVSLAVLLSAFQSQALAGSAPLSTQELKQAIGSGKKTVVFFINPMGKPCLTQKEILLKLQQDKAKQFNIAYVDASKPEDRKAFYDYGVRGLPSLALVDSSGNIAKIFPPGIQSYETLVQALDNIE